MTTKIRYVDLLVKLVYCTVTALLWSTLLEI